MRCLGLVLGWLVVSAAAHSTTLRRRDDAHGPETPDTAPGLPAIPLVPFAGNDSLPWSPPSYPSPNTTTNGWWDEPVTRARETVANLTIEDLVAFATGTGYGSGRCVGNIAPIPAASFPGLCLMDGPTGLRGLDLSTAFPPGITTGATFSKQLMQQRGEAIGAEFRAKGAQVHLGPMINVIRTPAAGRNWESFGADPYLNGEGAFYTTVGVQSQKVQAVLKHYIANEQEHFRNSGSSNVDERTERELYLHPFLRGIKAGAASVMAGYNMVNNSWMTQNAYLLNNRLKTELQFQGYVMSDWGAHHSGVDSALAGLDMSMPGGTSCCDMNISSFWGANLTTAVNNGSVPFSRVQDMATRVLASYYFLEQDRANITAPNFNFFDINDPATNEHVNVMADHHLVSREIVSAGTALLKNVNNSLPLQKPRSMVLLGSAAGPFKGGPHHYPDQIGWPYGAVSTGWGSGAPRLSYHISPYEALQRRARADNTGVDWSFDDFDLDTARAAANYTDVAIVFVSALSGEAYGTVPVPPAPAPPAPAPSPAPAPAPAPGAPSSSAPPPADSSAPSSSAPPPADSSAPASSAPPPADASAPASSAPPPVRRDAPPSPSDSPELAAPNDSSAAPAPPAPSDSSASSPPPAPSDSSAAPPPPAPSDSSAAPPPPAPSDSAAPPAPSAAPPPPAQPNAPPGTDANMGDRNNLTLWNGGEELIKAVASINPNTIVVVHAVGPVIMEDWIDHPNITGVLWANLPSSESGPSITNVLYGDYNPSGRLPYTIARSRDDYPAAVMYNSPSPQPQINYTEGLLVDYRWFDAKNITPRFEFGYGLSYTHFDYLNLTVQAVADGAQQPSTWADKWGNDKAPQGLPDWLFDPVYQVQFQLNNTGPRDGFEVPQMYLHFDESSGEPPNVLRNFDRVWVPRGTLVSVTYSLSYYDLATWNATHQQWRRPNGDITVLVGPSSRVLPLNATLP